MGNNIELMHISHEPTTQNPKFLSTINKPLFYVRIEIGESNDPCLPEVMLYKSQKLIPAGVDT